MSEQKPVVTEAVLGAFLSSLAQTFRESGELAQIPQPLPTMLLDRLRYLTLETLQPDLSEQDRQELAKLLAVLEAIHRQGIDRLVPISPGRSN